MPALSKKKTLRRGYNPLEPIKLEACYFVGRIQIVGEGQERPFRGTMYSKTLNAEMEALWVEMDQNQLPDFTQKNTYLVKGAIFQQDGDLRHTYKIGKNV